MAHNVLFLKGTEEAYKALEGSRSATTFYATESNLYLGDIVLNNEAQITEAVATVSEVLGDLSNLNTTNKNTLVEALNETLAEIQNAGGKVTIEETASGDTNVASIYTFKQDGVVIGTINLPKNLVLKSGNVVSNPEGQDPGTYIELTLNTETEDKIYINMSSLTDWMYSTEADATQVQLSIDEATREISATIVAGSITATEIAANAIVTTKIADKAVTKAKLADDVIAAFEVAGAAASALADAKAYTDTALTWTTF